MMETLEAPAFLEVNVKSFNLRDHYLKKQEELEASVKAFQSHQVQEE